MKIVVDVVNSEKVEAASCIAEIKAQEAQILKWNSAMATGWAAKPQELYWRMEHGGCGKIAKANTELRQLQQTSAGAGLGLSQLAYAVDDVQYGFNAIVNNIPQIVMGLGGGAGVAGAVGIAAVAINQLIKHWSEVSALMEQAWTGGSYDQLVTLREGTEAVLPRQYDDTSRQQRVDGMNRAARLRPKRLPTLAPRTCESGLRMLYWLVDT